MKKIDKRYKFWYACYDAGITEPEAYLGQLYINGMSCGELAEHLNTKYEIGADKRNVENYIKKMGIIRNRSEARKIAIRRGRVKRKDKCEGCKYYKYYMEREAK